MACPGELHSGLEPLRHGKERRNAGKMWRGQLMCLLAEKSKRCGKEEGTLSVLPAMCEADFKREKTCSDIFWRERLTCVYRRHLSCCVVSWNFASDSNGDDLARKEMGNIGEEGNRLCIRRRKCSCISNCPIKRCPGKPRFITSIF